MFWRYNCNVFFETIIKIMKNFILSIFAALALLSCKSKTVVQTNVLVEKPVVNSNKAFFDKILKKDDFESIKISSKIDAETGQFVPTLDATFYIENNQKVWINLQALFINMARGIATPSGIKGYEKVNKTYIDSDFSYINNLLKVNFIDYNSLQNLLLGKTFVPVNENDYSLTPNEQGFVLNSIKNQIFETNGKKSEYKISLDYDKELDLKKVFLQDLTSKNTLEINYENFENIGSQKLPKNVKIIIKGQKTNQIFIENTKFDFLKMETPFSIPANYTKTIIK